MSVLRIYKLTKDFHQLKARLPLLSLSAVQFDQLNRSRPIPHHTCRSFHFNWVESRWKKWTWTQNDWVILGTFGLYSILLGSISQVIIAPSNSSLFVLVPKQAVNSANSPSDSIRVLHEEALKKIEEESSVIGSVSWSSPNQDLSWSHPAPVHG